MASKPPEPSRTLSGADAAFLYLERKEIPLHIACVSEFDGPIPFDQFLAKVDSKLHLIPLYRQVAVTPPYHVGYPTWEWDPRSISVTMFFVCARIRRGVKGSYRSWLGTF